MTRTPPLPPPGIGEDSAPKRRRFLAAVPSAAPVGASNEPHAEVASEEEDDFPLLTEVVSLPEPESEAPPSPFSFPPGFAGEHLPATPVSSVTPLSADLARALEARLAQALPQIIVAAQDAALAVLHERIEQATQAAIEGALADLLHAAPSLPTDPSQS